MKSPFREALGEGFVRDFSARLEQVGVDVVHIPCLSTAYSFAVGGRPVVVVQTTGNWFCTNWSIAHEVGNLALGHQVATPGTDGTEEIERQANAFAADLLLPRETMSRINWADPDLSRVGKFLWETGVSTKAVRSRLGFLGLPVSAELIAELDFTTQISAPARRLTDKGLHHQPHDRVCGAEISGMAQARPS